MIYKVYGLIALFKKNHLKDLNFKFQFWLSHWIVQSNSFVYRSCLYRVSLLINYIVTIISHVFTKIIQTEHESGYQP